MIVLCWKWSLVNYYDVLVEKFYVVRASSSWKYKQMTYIVKTLQQPLYNNSGSSWSLKTLNRYSFRSLAQIKDNLANSTRFPMTKVEQFGNSFHWNQALSIYHQKTNLSLAPKNQELSANYHHFVSRATFRQQQAFLCAEGVEDKNNNCE